LTNEIFDALQIDLTSVRFGPGEAAPFGYRAKDVDNDGDVDLVLRFKTRDTGIQCDDTEATLTGTTHEDQEITGTDFINVEGCRNYDHHLDHEKQY